MGGYIIIHFGLRHNTLGWGLNSLILSLISYLYVLFTCLIFIVFIVVQVPHKLSTSTHGSIVFQMIGIHQKWQYLECVRFINSKELCYIFLEIWYDPLLRLSNFLWYPSLAWASSHCNIKSPTLNSRSMDLFLSNHHFSISY